MVKSDCLVVVSLLSYRLRIQDADQRFKNSMHNFMTCTVAWAWNDKTGFYILNSFHLSQTREGSQRFFAALRKEESLNKWSKDTEK